MAQILVPFDFSPTAQAALDQALLIASKNNKSVEVLHITNKAVCRDYPPSWECNEKTVEKLQQKVEVIVEERNNALGLAVGDAASAFVEEAAMVPGGITERMLRTSAKLLVMGTHGSSGLFHNVFGSNTSVLVNHALYPVLTVPPNWKPVPIEHCIAALKLSKLSASAETIKAWSQFFYCSVEAVQFSILPEGEGEFAKKTSIGGVPCRMIKNAIETTLAEDLLQFTKPLQNTILMLFTREKTFMEKLFTPNLTYKISGAITIPLLSLPLDNSNKP